MVRYACASYFMALYSTALYPYSRVIRSHSYVLICSMHTYLPIDTHSLSLYEPIEIFMNGG